MRLLVVLLLVHGLAPGLSEVGEAAVHWAVTGHAAHSADDHGDLGDLGDEHGCGTTQHRCGCCPTQVVAAPERAGVAVAHPGAGGLPPRAEAPPGAPERARLLRPPIA